MALKAGALRFLFVKDQLSSAEEGCKIKKDYYAGWKGDRKNIVDRRYQSWGRMGAYLGVKLVKREKIE